MLHEKADEAGVVIVCGMLNPAYMVYGSNFSILSDRKRIDLSKRITLSDAQNYAMVTF